MLVDIVIPPFYNKMPQVMKLYDSLIKQRVDNYVNFIIINNGSTDGMRPSNFHKDSNIKYVSSDKKINEPFLLSHALLKESKSEYVNILSFHSDINTNYISNLLKVLDKSKKDIILGGIETLKSRRGTAKNPDKRLSSSLKIPEDFFFENIVFKRDTIMKAGLFDRRLGSILNSVKMLSYHMIKTLKASYEFNNTFSITLLNQPTKDVNRTLNRYLIDFDNFKYVYKNYIDKEVYRLAKGVDKDKIYSAPVNMFIILPTKNNNTLEHLIEEQKSKKDILHISNLPKYMSKRLGYLIQKYSSFHNIVIVHENAPFKHSYFVDNFKIESCYNEDLILASADDFSVVELRPSTVIPNMSICVPKRFLWEPGLNEIMDWDGLIKKFSTMQPDQTIGDLLNPPKEKTVITNTSGDGGPVVVPAIGRSHKKSWYNWMED